MSGKVIPFPRISQTEAHAILESLSREDRVIFTMAYTQGFTDEEIAGQFGITYRHAKMLRDRMVWSVQQAIENTIELRKFNIRSRKGEIEEREGAFNEYTSAQAELSRPQ